VPCLVANLLYDLAGTSRLFIVNGTVHPVEPSPLASMTRFPFRPYLVVASLLCGLTTILLSEVKSDILIVGSRSYKNATVTLEGEVRAKIVHEDGIARVDPADLPADIQKQLGWMTVEQKEEALAKTLEANYPIVCLEIPDREVTDKRVRDELNKFLDAHPDGKALALVIHRTKNPKAHFFIKIIFDKDSGQLFHLKTTVPAKGVVRLYDLTKWNGIDREKLRGGIPWTNEKFEPLGKSQSGTSPLNLNWKCKARPEITEWP